MKYFHSYLCCFLLFILLASPVDVSAQSRKELEEQKEKISREIEETNQFLKETQKSQKESLDKLNLLAAQVTRFHNLINSINAEIRQVERQINESSARIKQMGNEIEKLKAEYAQLIYHAYKNRGKYNKLIYILSASDFNEAYRRMNYFRQYSDYRKVQVEDIRKTQEELNNTIKELAEQKAEKEKLLVEQRDESKRLGLAQTELNGEVKNLKSKEKQLRQQLLQKQRAAQKLQKEIEKLIASEITKRKGTSTSADFYDKLTPEERLVSDNFKDNRGRLPWPTERGIVTGYFGKNIPHPLFKEIRRDNNGIDITTVNDANVRAIFDGEVTQVMRIPGENLVVFVQHGRYFTVYNNLVGVTVKKGDKIKVKDIIGKVYTEKASKTAVLHFEIREETVPLNPELWLQKR
ncbi:MAG: peptidoglycan DD-metalloendopeptidase family protein [Prevotellaceae bacterium]|jgi:septal ring factor EnvC (AmiA/AmiB activator)|nr:peptidoglycan DD-metalloendopeptidase family protein [Prevotellaceae bacterium]